MSTKTSSNDYLQVVFLIDENSTNINDKIKGKDASNSVCLCVLRILSYFNELRDRNSFSLRWGFKFYNSRSLKQRYQRHNFKEFCVSEFENFEKDVCERFEEELRCQAHEQNSVEVSHNDEEYACNTATTRLTASKSLTCAFTDLVHDFQWEINDLNSPLRSTRRSNTLQHSSRRTHNVVFLLSKCPRDFDSLREFCGFKIQDLNTLRNAMMSSALLKEFKEVYNISLNWINTDYCESDVMDQHVIDMMEEFLQTFSGTLIPLQSLVGTQRHPSSSLASSVTGISNSSMQYDMAMPIMSVLGHYMGKLKCARAIGQSCTSVIKIEYPEDGTVMNSWSGWLCSPGAKPVVHCTLRLSSMLSSHSPTNTGTKDSSSAPSSTSNPSLMIRQQSSTSSTFSSHRISLSAPDIPSTDHEINNTQKKCPNVFWIKGAVRRDKICPSWFHVKKVYTCVAMVTEKGNEISPGVSGWFQRLMLTLAKQNLSLVIELRDPECGIPVTSVLQPLTSICGVLSIINSSKLLTLEKLLLLNQRSSSKGMVHDSEQILVEGLNIPESVADGSRTATATARNLTSSEIHSPLNVQWSDGCSSESFSTQDLSSWSLGLACLEQGPDVTSPSAEKCSDNGSSHESSLIRKLKELYSKKRSKKSKLEDKKTKLKHLEKRKKDKKMHEQVKKELQKEEARCSGPNTAKDTNSPPVVPSCNIPSDNDVQKDNTDATSEVEKKEMMILLENLQLDVEQDLKNFLKDAYHQAVTNMDSLTKFIDKCIAVIDFYLRKSKTDTQELTVQGVLADCLLLSNLAIRDKYEGLKSSDCKQHKLTEYQLQVLLRLEMICAGSECTSLIDEVVVMLRSISFIKDPGFLRDFLKEVILTRYVQHIPKFLCEIYEGLMQDLPPELQSPSKQNSEEEESPLKRNQVPSVVRPESDQPRSEISRPLTRHRSIADMGGKRREIVIPGKAKAKTKTGRSKTTLSKKENSDHCKGKSQKTPVKKVRRNLFTDEEEEESSGMSVNPMSKSKLKVPSIFGKEERCRHHRIKESRRYSVVHSKMVKETPGRKQIHNALWQRQHRARKRTCTETDLNIVKESPLKEILEAENLPRRSPRRHPGSTFQRSQSFYGGNPKSCPLVRTRSSSSIRSGSPMKKLDLDENTDASNLATDAMETITTPVKDTQYTVKESPLRFSPRRKKRFALHTLLTETTIRTKREHSNSKTLTPRSKGEAPVRSSPRLLKKRSFSCIGFSNSLSSYSKGGNSSGGNRITTPSKNKVLTPRRSSPRFKKSASDSIGMARNRDGLTPPRTEQNRLNPELRKKPQTSPRSGLSGIKCEELSSGSLSKKTETTERLVDQSNKPSKLSDNENDSEDSEVFLNLDKQPSLDQSDSACHPNGLEDQSLCGVNIIHKANSTGRKRVLDHYSSVMEQRDDADDKPSVDAFDLSIQDDTSNEQSTRIFRSGGKGSFELKSEVIGYSPQFRNKVLGCHSERKSVRSEREVFSRKRLSFSPSKNTESHDVSKNSSNTPVDGCLDNHLKNESSNKTKLKVDEGTMNKESDEDGGVNTRSDDAENLVDNTIKVGTPLRRSPRKHLVKNSPVCGSQRLLTPKPVVSTPPPKKRRKTRSQTEQETKRSSPLNQILKQRKRNRTGSLKSPKSTAHSEVGADTVTHKGPKDVISEGQADGLAQLAMELLDECSKSSEDMVYDWFRHIDNQENPVEPTAMTGVPSVQRCTGLSDFGFDEDDVFRNPPNTLRSGRPPYKPSTPISAKSIKMLRESPLLVNSSSIHVPPGSLSKRWSDSSPSGRERLKRRKRSEAFGGNSSEMDTSVSDDGETIAERHHERNATRSRKRIKLNTN